MAIEVVGRTVNRSGDPVGGLRLEAWDAQRAHEQPLAAATTTAAGEFRIELSEDLLAHLLDGREPSLFIRLFDGDVEIPMPEDERAWAPGRPDTEIVVDVHDRTRSYPGVVDGTVVDAASGSPAPGLSVAARLDGGPPFASAITDDDGRFVLRLPVRNGSQQRHATLTVADVRGTTLVSKEFDVGRATRHVEVEVEVETVGTHRVRTPIAELRAPRELVADLARRGVETLDELRSLPTTDDEPRPLRTLRAHAALSTLDVTAEESSALIRKGFHDLGAVARTPRAEFVEALAPRIGSLEAGALHANATTQSNFLSQVAAGALATPAAAGEIARSVSYAIGAVPTCSCSECSSAVSPAAYLAALLEYTLDHVRNAGNAVTLSGLHELFQQPFRDLPLSCDSTNRRVREVRLAVDVLRGYVASIWTNVSQEARDAIADAESRYLVDVYTLLLSGLGTSYEEIRHARVATAAARETLAQRIGLRLDRIPNALDDLFLDLPGTAGAVTDAKLEERFGLKSTRSSNPLDPPADGLIREWRKQSLRWAWRDADWPPDPWQSEFAPQALPVIDPDIVTRRDIRFARVGNKVYDTWRARRTWVDGTRVQLEQDRQAHGLDPTLSQVFGTPLPDFAQLADELAQGATPAATKAKVEALGLTVESLPRLVEIRAKAGSPAPAGQPTASDWSDLDAILTQALKLAEYTTWIQDEQAKQIRLDAREFWITPEQPTPPKWLGSSETRRSWEGALARRHARPVIDPDLIGLGDLQHPEASDPTFQLWKERQTWIDGRLQSFQNAAKTSASFDSRVRNALGLTQQQLDNLLKEYRQGVDLKATLVMLTLDVGELKYLARIRSLFDDNQPVTDPEWAEAASIVVDVQKRREYSEWQRLERLADVVLEPDRFQIPQPGTPTPALDRWRAKRSDRLDWQDRLAARIDQFQTVDAAIDAAISDAEDATLPGLRDALIDAAAEGVAADDRADWLTDHLLIDMKTGACQMTTRIAQAIETIQQLLFQLRTDQLRDTYPELELRADRFDDEWRWLGSYATWRAAIFVLLYPENLLVPSLRRHQSWAFRKLVDDLRSSRRLTPTQAKQRAQDYAGYFRDVTELRVAACCEGPIRVDRTGIGSRDYRASTHLIGVGSNSGTVYWSRYETGSTAGYAQTSWSPIDSLTEVRVHKVIGATSPGPTSPTTRYLTVFVHGSVKNEEKIGFTQLNLEEPGGGWSDFSELDLPTDAAEVDVVFMQGGGAHPKFVLRVLDRAGKVAVYLKTLAGDEWSDDNWTPMSLQIANAPLPVPTTLYGAVELYEHVRCLFVGYGDGYLYGLFMTPWMTVGPAQKLGTMKSWQGAIVLGDSPPGTPTTSGDGRVYAFWHDGFTSRYQSFAWTPAGFGTITPKVTSFNSFLGGSDGRLAVDDSPGQLPTQIAYYLDGTPKGVYTSSLDRLGIDSVLKEGTRRPIAPQFAPPDDVVGIVERLADPQRRLDVFSWILPSIEASWNRAANVLASNRVYLEEEYYFLPVLLALKLQERSEYVAALDWLRAVYDYGAPPGDPMERRKIYEGLVEEESSPFNFERAENWLLDPLDPHGIAATRRNAYTRFTILTLVRCLLQYADAEYTTDTAESLPRARTLYRTALELLEAAELEDRASICVGILGMLDIEVGGPEWVPALGGLGRRLEELQRADALAATVKQLNHVLSGTSAMERRYERARQIVDDALAEPDEAPPAAAALKRLAEGSSAARVALLADEDVAHAAAALGARTADTMREFFSLEGGDAAARSTNGQAVALLNTFDRGRPTGAFSPAPVYGFCIPPNPIPEALRGWAELNLLKLRSCLNIAGMEREVDPYAAPTDLVSGLPTITAGGALSLPGVQAFRPTQYRYSFLIARARELVQLAGQVENSMLVALEHADAERYSRLKAGNDLGLARAGVRLQSLRVREAEGGVKLADLTRQRAQLGVQHYEELLDAGWSTSEQAAVVLLGVAASFHAAAAAFSTVSAVDNFAASGIYAYTEQYGAAASSSAAGWSAIASAASSTASAAQTAAAVLGVVASFERRQQEWEYQLALENQDVLIGDQQVRVAEDHVNVTLQEQQIAQLQADQANDTLEFLATKFTNLELYDYMAGVLERVYSFFLQQATSVAQMAAAQLAFERQQPPPPVIRPDYWEASGSDGMLGGEDGPAPDRRGLTGSARLLEDLTELDQYAFSTDTRRLNLTATFSLRQLDPLAFTRFRADGVLPFATPTSLFDRQFPGHYLRLIRRVRVSVIALVPAVTGIHATLSRVGPSWVVIGGPPFQRVAVNHLVADEVALTSPYDASGVFELDVQPQMLLPFEGVGVDTRWTLRMPKAANAFDYDSIFDVLVTIDYTALSSDDYRREVISSLSPTAQNDALFSIRQQFPDAWYALNNPDESTTPFEVELPIRRVDLPPNLESLAIANVSVFVSPSQGAFDDPISIARLDVDGVGGAATTTLGGLASTRGTAAAWLVLQGRSPVGTWKLAFPDNADTRTLFADGLVDDVALVVGYRGRTADWV